MNNNATIQSLIMHCRCNFSHMIIGTYNMALSCHFQREYCKNLSYPIIIKGNLKEKGSKFIIKRQDLNLYIFYEILEIVITDYYACFKYHVYKTIPETYEYDYILQVRYINEDQCDFFVCFVFDHRIYLSERDMREEMKFKKDLYKNIERSLINYDLLKICYVYTEIKCKIELIVDILKNMKVIHKYCHILADEINYEDEILKKNSIIDLIEVNNNTILKSKAIVHKSTLNKSDISKEYILEFLFNKNKDLLTCNSKTKIMIIIYEYNGYCSLYLLYFFYYIQKNKENFINFAKLKNRELLKFKAIITNYNNKIYSINSNQINNKLNYKND